MWSGRVGEQTSANVGYDKETWPSPIPPQRSSFIVQFVSLKGLVKMTDVPTFTLPSGTKVPAVSTLILPGRLPGQPS